MNKILRNIFCASLLAFIGTSSIYAATQSGTSSDTSGNKAIANTSTAANLDTKEVINKVEAAGYTNIIEVDKEGDHWEIECYNKQGERMELKMDMNGKIYKVKHDDED